MTCMELSGGASAEGPIAPEAIFERGMLHASGRDSASDLVAAHKWFNIAAARGHKDAIRLRREIAEQMSDTQIGLAQREARAWLGANPQKPRPEILVILAA